MTFDQLQWDLEYICRISNPNKTLSNASMWDNQPSSHGFSGKSDVGLNDMKTIILTDNAIVI